ncbi:MAG: hypothetical protein ACOYXY_15155 [Thermodesulfobacteriota bacterium]
MSEVVSGSGPSVPGLGSCALGSVRDSKPETGNHRRKFYGGFSLVWVKNIGMKPAFICGECGLGFSDAKTALACEEYCRKNKSCSPEIAKRAIYRD